MSRLRDRGLWFFLDKKCTRRSDDLDFKLNFSEWKLEDGKLFFTAYVKNPEKDDYEVFSVKHEDPEASITLESDSGILKPNKVYALTIIYAPKSELKPLYGKVTIEGRYIFSPFPKKEVTKNE